MTVSEGHCLILIWVVINVHYPPSRILVSGAKCSSATNCRHFNKIETRVQTKVVCVCVHRDYAEAVVGVASDAGGVKNPNFWPDATCTKYIMRPCHIPL